MDIFLWNVYLFSPAPFFCSFWCFEPGSYYVVVAGLKPTSTLLPQPRWGWSQMCTTTPHICFPYFYTSFTHSRPCPHHPVSPLSPSSPSAVVPSHTVLLTAAGFGDEVPALMCACGPCGAHADTPYCCSCPLTLSPLYSSRWTLESNKNSLEFWLGLCLKLEITWGELSSCSFDSSHPRSW